MDEPKEYNWKTLNLQKQYLSIKDVVSISFQTSNLKSSFFTPFLDTFEISKTPNIFDPFLKDYNAIRIPLKTKKLLDDLLLKNNIGNFNNEFYFLSCIFQEVYVRSIEKSNDLRMPLVTDFQDESKDLNKLLNIIHDKLKNGNTAISAISFKSRETKTINNFFIIKDILNLIINGYGINLDNFEERKLQLLENTNNIKFDLRDELWKYNFSKALYDFISKRDVTTDKILNKHIRFVGQFLCISQIPVIKTSFEVSNTKDLDSILEQSDIKYLSKFIFRPKSFFLS
jgi:hypothetical protein